MCSPHLSYFSTFNDGMKLKTALLTAVMTLGAAWVWGQNALWKSWEAQGDTLYRVERYVEAEPFYSRIINDAVKSKSEMPYAVLYKRGVCYFSTEQFEKAEKDLNVVVTAAPANFQGRILRGLIRQALGDEEGQWEDVNAAIDLQGQNPNLLRWRGSLSLRQGNYESAKRDLLIVRQFAEDPEVEVNLAVAYFNTGAPDSAFLAIDRGIEINATVISLYLYGASFALQEERFEKAWEYLQLGQRLDADNATLLFYQGAALLELKRETEACRCLAKAFAAGVDDAAGYLTQHCWSFEE